ncbi:MAG: hypothetical protein CBD27_02015 [Rhodospirillaceae bacterium TMED167]|mgnify:CR=1 FL=1|nr:MAG: hypothetical protein CBD27_02015 [Rhodospirillaceae bacterium TMED167]
MSVADTDIRYLEDFTVGEVLTWGSLGVTAEEIVRFGIEFDPIPIHTDADAAADSQFGTLIASGWHVAALMQRMQYECYIKRSSVIASPGVDGMAFLAPVRPGDELSLRAEITKVRRSQSKSDRGIIHGLISVINQDGVTVMTKKSKALFKRRPEA